MARFSPIRTGNKDLDRVQDEIARLLNPLLGQVSRDAPVVAQYETAAGQSIPNDVFVVVNYDTRVTDLRNSVATGTQWRFTAPLDGLYVVQASACFVMSAVAAEVMVSLFKAGVEVTRGTRLPLSQASFPVATLSTAIQLAAGESIDIRARQISGSAVNLWTTNSVGNQVSIHRLPGS